MTTQNNFWTTATSIIVASSVGILWAATLCNPSEQKTEKKEPYIKISSSYHGEMHLTKDEFQRYFERMCAENKSTVMSSRLVDSAIEMNYRNILLLPKQLQTNGLWRLVIETDISSLRLDNFKQLDDYSDLVAYAIELYGEESVSQFFKKDE